MGSLGSAVPSWHQRARWGPCDPEFGEVESVCLRAEEPAARRAAVCSSQGKAEPPSGPPLLWTELRLRLPRTRSEEPPGARPGLRLPGSWASLLLEAPARPLSPGSVRCGARGGTRACWGGLCGIGALCARDAPGFRAGSAGRTGEGPALGALRAERAPGSEAEAPQGFGALGDVCRSPR